MGFLLLGIQFWLFCLEFNDDYVNSGGGILLLSLTLTLFTLMFCFFCPRNSKARFAPFMLALFILLATLLFEPI